MQTEAAPARRPTLTSRSTASRKVASAKAAEKAPEPETGGEVLEASSPTPSTAVAEDHAAVAELPVVAAEPDLQAAPASDVAEAPTELAEPEPEAQQPATAEQGAEPSACGTEQPESAPQSADQPAGPAQPAPAPAWSTEDESALQAMLARRKAAGYQRRGRDVGAQLLRVGEIAPNPSTVVATIVALVAERGAVARGALLDAMAGAAFPHPKAKPGDLGWCQGYVAGAVRDGFLAVGGDPAEAAR